MARRGTWHGVQCHAMPRFRVNVARHGAWRATRGAEIFTRATPCHVFKPTRHALCPVKTWHGVAWRATPGPKKTGGAITAGNHRGGQKFTSWRTPAPGHFGNLGFLILKVKIPEIETFTKFEGFPNLLFLSGLCAYSKHIKQG